MAECRATGSGDDEVEEDLLAFGAPPEVIAQYTDTGTPDLFPVHPRNWQILTAFMAVRTQWTPAPFRGVLGLNYQGVEVALRALQITITPELWRGITLMEGAALEKMNEFE